MIEEKIERLEKRTESLEAQVRKLFARTEEKRHSEITTLPMNYCTGTAIKREEVAMQIRCPKCRHWFVCSSQGPRIERRNEVIGGVAYPVYIFPCPDIDCGENSIWRP